MSQTDNSAKKDVFISYSTKDQTAKNYIKEVFDEAGITYFLDEVSLELGEDIERSLEENLNRTNFTVLLVSKNSLFSTWVSLESIHRLRQQEYSKTTTFLPVLVDLEVMDLEFPIEMINHYKNKHEELEAIREKAKKAGLPTKVYNDEIERIDVIIPQVGEIVQKIKNGLSANFADENRKEADLAKLIRTIKAQQEKTKPTDIVPEKPTGSKFNNRYFWYAGIGVIILIFLLIFSMDNSSETNETNEANATDNLNKPTTDSLAFTIGETYFIESKVFAGKVFDVSQSSKNNGAAILLYPIHQQDNQKFTLGSASSGYIILENVNSKKLLEWQDKLQQNDYQDNMEFQRFKPIPAEDDYFYLELAAKPNYVLTASKGENGVINIDLKELSKSPNQMFKFTPAD
ncbi:MAG: TIR domain-containing protein [Microscillaceae bacterium]|jgi:hypothetical protein|nr:TIR domain-containing protein [Microscillaceae bacterium]